MPALIGECYAVVFKSAPGGEFAGIDDGSSEFKN